MSRHDTWENVFPAIHEVDTQVKNLELCFSFFLVKNESDVKKVNMERRKGTRKTLSTAKYFITLAEVTAHIIGKTLWAGSLQLVLQNSAGYKYII